MNGNRRRRRRASRVLIAFAAMIAVAAAVAAASGFTAGLRGGSAHGGTGGSLPPATARVSRQTLVDAQTESGSLGHGETTTLTGRLAGTVTALPAPGATIQRGEVLYRVDNAPVVLLYGPLPAYRALSPGTKGPDVKQFEQNLAALGYRGFTVDETYNEATAVAVKKWQKALGLTVTGTVELGRVTYAMGALRVDTQKVAVGDEARPGAGLYTCTGTARVVTVKLAVADERLAKVGNAVTVTLPGGRQAPARITKVRTYIDTGSNANDKPTTKIEVSVAVDDESTLAGLDQAAVTVGFTASQRENVLTVPVAALLALAEGGYGVQVVDGATTRIVAVQTGLFAAGRVEITGEGLAEGMTVGMPS